LNTLQKQTDQVNLLLGGLNGKNFCIADLQ